MNTVHKLSARICMSFVCIAMCFTSQIQAQKEYTSISKNINPEAQSLYHDLSPQGDSLFLKAESIFYKVTFLNSLDRKVYTFNPPVLVAKISLQDIIVGDYTVLVYKKDRIIVFHISRLLEIEKLSEFMVAKELHLSSDTNIETPVIAKVNLKVKPAMEVNMNKINLDENFDLNLKGLKIELDKNDLALNKNLNELITDNMSSIKPYNISSMDRSNVQSREAYRTNNLRPNGKPYY